MQTPATTTTIPDGVPTIQRPEHKVAAHIRDAADATGVPFDFLLAQAHQESRLDPEAKNRRSSAMGLYQFTAGTWIEMVKKHGGDHGLDHYADAITRGSDGRWAIKDKDLKKEILELRRDPRLSALMAAEYAKDNEQVLEARLGRKASNHDLYLAHFLGAGGALKVLKGRDQADTDQQPMELAGAARANPEIFHDPASGEQKSLNSVYATMEKSYRRAMSEAAKLARDLSPEVDLAALTPEARPEEIIAVTPGAADDPVIASAMPEPAPESAPEQEPAPLAALSSFPARLPPRLVQGNLPDTTETQGFPVALPPPVTGARADAGTWRGLWTRLKDLG